jgi:hypothetical protein
VLSDNELISQRQLAYELARCIGEAGRSVLIFVSGMADIEDLMERFEMDDNFEVSFAFPRVQTIPPFPPLLPILSTLCMSASITNITLSTVSVLSCRVHPPDGPLRVLCAGVCDSR